MNSRFVTDFNATGESLLETKNRRISFSLWIQTVRAHLIQFMFLLVIVSIVMLLWKINNKTSTTQNMVQDNNRQVVLLQQNTQGFQKTYEQMYYCISEEVDGSQKDITELQSKIQELYTKLEMVKKKQHDKNIEWEQTIGLLRVEMEEKIQKVQEERNFDREQLRIFYEKILEKMRKARMNY